MLSRYRLAYLGVIFVVIGAVAFVAAETEQRRSSRNRLAFFTKATPEEILLARTELTAQPEPGNLSEAGARELRTNGDFLGALVQSRETPVLVFKHDSLSVASGAAYRRVAGWLRDRPMDSPVTFVIKTNEHRGTSLQIEYHTRVPHEAPQVILLVNGESVWHASHEEITSNALSAALDAPDSQPDESVKPEVNKKMAGYQSALAALPQSGAIRGALAEVGATEMLTIADWEMALAESREHPVLIFKHGTSCGGSGNAYREVAKWMVDQGASAPPVYGVRVRESRPVSNEIERALGVKHESPQAILIRDGNVLWHADHGGVTGETVAQAFADAASAAPAS